MAVRNLQHKQNSRDFFGQEFATNIKNLQKKTLMTQTMQLFCFSALVPKHWEITLVSNFLREEKCVPTFCPKRFKCKSFLCFLLSTLSLGGSSLPSSNLLKSYYTEEERFFEQDVDDRHDIDFRGIEIDYVLIE